MKTVQVYDKPMCCSTGVCGPEVDPVLPRFAADLDWLKARGHHVERYNLAQEPMSFAQNPVVQQFLNERGTEYLPLVLVDGVAVSEGEYPSRERLAAWTGERSPQTLPVTDQSGSCCGGTDCC